MGCLNEQPIYPKMEGLENECFQEEKRNWIYFFSG